METYLCTLKLTGLNHVYRSKGKQKCENQEEIEII